MRNNIVIDDSLLTKAIELSGLKTKKDTVELALREFVQKRSRINPFDLAGCLADDYDYKSARGRPLN
ncbi:hypothetical protein FACS1894184_14510 [Clostridia bacterium]|nr:hypothetical protein FACS1894184_14510 [Clostridia bacterium]